MSYTKEEVINGLIACSDDINGCTKCPFHDCGCFPELRDAIIELLESQGEPPEIDPETLPIVKELLERTERAEKQLAESELKRGHWIPCGSYSLIDEMFVCSSCRRRIYCNRKAKVDDVFPYCHCGAKMSEEL